jgi:alkylation response protein AidB-like acyl-CoA dehydrogenase
MFQLDEEQRLILQSVQEIAQEEIKPRATVLDETGQFPWDTVHLFAKNDMLNPLLPRKYGGVEVSTFMFCMIIEEIAKACASSALLLISQAEGTLPIIYGGDEALKKKYLGRLTGDSQILAALGTPEPTDHVKIFSHQIRAELQGGKYLIHGEKCLIKNGSIADFLVLYVNTDPSKPNHRMTALVVERGSPGLVYGRNEDKMGMRGCHNTEIILKNLEVPFENLIGKKGEEFSNMMKKVSRIILSVIRSRIKD